MDVFQLCAQFARDHIWVPCKLLAEIFGRRMWSEEEAIAICWINCVTTDLMFTSTQLMHSQSMQNLFILFRACAYDLFNVHVFQRPDFSLLCKLRLQSGLPVMRTYHNSRVCWYWGLITRIGSAANEDSPQQSGLLVMRTPFIEYFLRIITAQ